VALGTKQADQLLAARDALRSRFDVDLDRWLLEMRDAVDGAVGDEAAHQHRHNKCTLSPGA
jgi:hypothetical protein